MLHDIVPAVPLVPAAGAGPTGTTQRAFRSVAGALTVAVALATLPAALRAQVVRQTADSGAVRGTITVAGVVLDSAGRVLEGAEVSVGPRFVGHTDGRGVFLLRGVPAERGRLAVRRIGFRPATLDLAPDGPGMRLEVEVRLAATVARLDEVIVEGRAVDRALWEVGFYRRERVARGRFLDPDFLATFSGTGVAALVRETPRVMVERRGNEYFAYGPIAGGRCRLHVFVDGKYAREAMPGPNGKDPGMPLDQVVPRDDIHAMEVYPTFTAVPAEFTRLGPAAGPQETGANRLPAPNPRPGGLPPVHTPRAATDDAEDNKDAACGAIVIWTKTFTARRQRAGSGRTP